MAKMMKYKKPKMSGLSDGMMGKMSTNPYNVRMDAPTMPRAAKQRGTGTTMGYRISSKM